MREPEIPEADDAEVEGLLSLDGILHDTTLLEFLQELQPKHRTLFLHCLAVTKRVENRVNARRMDLERQLVLRLENLEVRMNKLDEIVYVLKKTFTIGKIVWAPALVVAGVILGVRLSP